MVKQYNLDGVSPTVQFGKGGPRISHASGIFSARAVNNDLTRLQIATPTAAEDATTKAFVESLTNPLDTRLDAVEARQTKSMKITGVTNNQTTFTLPAEVNLVVQMTVNGIETSAYTFAAPTLTFDPVAAEYSIEATDEILIVYTT